MVLKFLAAVLLPLNARFPSILMDDAGWSAKTWQNSLESTGEDTAAAL